MKDEICLRCRNLFNSYSHHKLDPHLCSLLTMCRVQIYTHNVAPSFPAAYSMIKQLSPWHSAGVTWLALGPRGCQALVTVTWILTGSRIYCSTSVSFASSIFPTGHLMGNGDENSE